MWIFYLIFYFDVYFFIFLLFSLLFSGPARVLGDPRWPQRPRQDRGRAALPLARPLPAVSEAALTQFGQGHCDRRGSGDPRWHKTKMHIYLCFFSFGSGHGCLGLVGTGGKNHYFIFLSHRSVSGVLLWVALEETLSLGPSQLTTNNLARFGQGLWPCLQPQPATPTNN